jgi:ubiquinone/menaquinone biosynthesis C-methylase UbiE
MTLVIDPEGVEPGALTQLIDPTGLRVLEIGCGDGRLTWHYAGSAATVVGIDPSEESIAKARAAVPAKLAGRVRFEVKDVLELDEPASAFDLAFFSWSL